jgi:hypothetical protein
MLLSSIAMLLVALVALGSATYAWFTINKVVTADRMKVKAAAADGLVINNKKTAEWLPAVSFANEETILTPVSYAITHNAAMPTGYIAKDVKVSGAWSTGNTDISAFEAAPALPDDTYTDATYKFNSTTNVARYDVDVASSGDAINKAVKVKIEATGSGNTFAKAALVTGGKVVAFYTDGTAYSAIDSDTPSVAAAPAALGTTTPVQVMASVPTKDNAQAFQLYVWYEGNDPQCLDSALSPTNNTPVQFKLTFTLQ